MGAIFSRLAQTLVVLPLSSIYTISAQFASFIARAVVGQLGNEYLAGMVVWGMMGSFGEVLKKFYDQIHSWVLAQIFTNVRLGEQETKELMEYLRQHPSVPNSSMLTMKTHSNVESDVSGSRVYEYEPELNTAIRFYHKSPTTGHGSWIWVANYSYAESSTQPDPVVSTTVTILGRQKAPVEEMIDLGREMLRNKRRKFLQVITTYNYTQDNYGLGWNHGYKTDKKQPGRSIKSVILPRENNFGGSTATNNNNDASLDQTTIHVSPPMDQAEALLADAREFLESERWYTERGIPYRRGYLLWGIPGGGKSSLVAAVASELKLPIYMLQLSNELLTDDGLHRLFQTMTENPSILLLEDIDAASDLVKKRKDDEEDEEEEEEADEQEEEEEEEEEEQEEEQEEEDKASVEEEDEEQNGTQNTIVLTPKRPDSENEPVEEIIEDDVKEDEREEEDAIILENQDDPDDDNISISSTESISTPSSSRKKKSSKSSTSSALSTTTTSSQDNTNILMLQLMKQQQQEQKQDREEKKKRDRKLTLSGLLNALDGPTATTGRLLFMTTNFKNKLDHALIRSGRIDYDIEFKHVDGNQADRIFQRFYLSFRDVDERNTSSDDTSSNTSSDTNSNAGNNTSDSNNRTTNIEGSILTQLVTQNDIEKEAAEENNLSMSTPPKLTRTSSIGVEKQEVRDLAKIFARAVKSSGLSFSAADLQGHLMKYKSNPRLAVNMVESQLLKPKRNKKGTKSPKKRYVSPIPLGPTPTE